MSARARGRLAIAVWVVVMLALAVTAWLSLRNGSFSRDGGFLWIAVVMIVGYGGIGAYLASRLPQNAIGWLMLAVAGAFALAGMSDEWVTYTVLTDPGALPALRFMAWLTNWVFITVIWPIPFILVLFPTGNIPSPRWRWVLAVYTGALTVGSIGTILRPGFIDVSGLVQVANPTGVEALKPVVDVALAVAGFAGLGTGLVLAAAPFVRFRRVGGEERQQLRWLAYVTAAAGIALAAALLTGIGLHGDETRLSNEISFYVFFVMLGIGVPYAIAVALLRYRLWDLDIVVKKALVFTVVAVALTLLGVLVLLLFPVAVLGSGLSGWERGLFVVGVALGVLVGPLRRRAQRIADRIVYGGRATPYEVLTEFSDRMAETYSTDDVLPRMAGIVGAGTGAERVTIWLLVGREMLPAAGWPADTTPHETRPMAALVEADPGTFEVRHQGELLGAITVTMPSNDPMNPSRERLIRDLASQAGLVLRNVRLIEELRASRRRLVAAQDAERRRVERNIHDGAQQQLVALAVKLRLAEQMVERDPAKAREMLTQLQSQTDDTLEDLRDLARGIYPPLLADEGLAAALRAQARKVPVPVEVVPDGIGRYDQEVEAAVYFCVLEALQNVAKYAGASTVRIGLEDDGASLSFTVSDDGVGFDRAATTRGTGLQGMADRVDALGGSLEVMSAPGEGATVLGRIPVR